MSDMDRYYETKIFAIELEKQLRESLFVAAKSKRNRKNGRVRRVLMAVETSERFAPEKDVVLVYWDNGITEQTAEEWIEKNVVLKPEHVRIVFHRSVYLSDLGTVQKKIKSSAFGENEKTEVYPMTKPLLERSNYESKRLNFKTLDAEKLATKGETSNELNTLAMVMAKMVANQY